MGLCGSLTQHYSVGDALLYQNCWNSQREEINLDAKLVKLIQSKLSVDLVTGLTSDRLIYQATEKLSLSQTYPVSVVDMEGYDYIKELQDQGISVAMLRVVSDDLTGDIPNLSDAIDSNGNLKSLSMAFSFFKQPIPAIRLIRGSLIGLNVLQKITTKLFS